MGARRFAATLGGESLVVSVFRPDPASHRPERPQEVTATCSNLHQLIGIRGVRDNHLIAFYAIRKRAERLEAFQRLRRVGAGTHAAGTFASRDIRKE